MNTIDQQILDARKRLDAFISKHHGYLRGLSTRIDPETGYIVEVPRQPHIDRQANDMFERVVELERAAHFID